MGHFNADDIQRVLLRGKIFIGYLRDALFLKITRILYTWNAFSQIQLNILYLKNIKQSFFCEFIFKNGSTEFIFISSSKIVFYPLITKNLSFSWITIFLGNKVWKQSWSSKKNLDKKARTLLGFKFPDFFFSNAVYFLIIFIKLI